MGSNAIRFTGLSSGMDTETIVKALLTKEQNKIDGENKKQTLLGWKKDAWKEMNTKISSFNSKYVDKLRLASTYLANKATVSNENAISVKTGTTIPTGTHEISDIVLAKSAIKSGAITSTEVVGTVATKDLTKSTKLSDMGITIAADNSTTITFNGVSIGITADETIGTLEAKMQAKATALKLNVNFDMTNKNLFISSKETGLSSKISISSNSASLLTGLGMDASVKEGTDASLKYNGTTITSSSNNISVNGFDITLKQATTDKIYITASQDTESTVTFVKEFITEYNKLIEEINTKLDTKKSRTYQPLTDAEKEKMTDKEIETWEDKIKGSLFYRDSSVTSVRDMLRDQIGGVVNNSNSSYKVLSDMGITSGTWQENGKLYLDEGKLTKALQTKPNEVIDLLTGNGSEAEARKAFITKTNGTDADYDALGDGQKKWLTSTKGIFTRISEQFLALSKSTELKSYGSFYNDKLDTEEGRTIADNILKYQDKFDANEKRLYAKFTAMEKAMTQMNSQSSTLTNMLG